MCVLRCASINNFLKKKEPPPSFNQVTSLQITRNEICEWIFTRLFDKTLSGKYVKLYKNNSVYV